MPFEPVVSHPWVSPSDERMRKPLLRGREYPPSPGANRHLDTYSERFPRDSVAVNPGPVSRVHQGWVPHLIRRFEAMSRSGTLSRLTVADRRSDMIKWALRKAIGRF